MENTVRFGTSSSPCRTPAAAAAGALMEDDSDGKGKNDPDKLLQCPFDKNHQIRAFRFPYHLIKCRKNHPKLARELQTCPFNARHLVHKHELAHHIETCESRAPVATEDCGSASGISKWKVPVSTWVNPNMTKDWDKEAYDDAPPFVWGESKVLCDLPETRPIYSLSRRVKPPKTFPWTGL